VFLGTRPEKGPAAKTVEKVILLPETIQDAVEARDWYEARRSSLGKDLVLTAH
jgi:hypothetical protein